MCVMNILYILSIMLSICMSLTSTYIIELDCIELCVNICDKYRGFHILLNIY